jgi:hypothetical protein
MAGIALELFSHNHVWIIMAMLAVLDRPAASQPAPLAETAPLVQTG